MRGLEIKDDTYAIIKVVRADGQPIPLLDSGSSTGTSSQNTNFILQSVQEARMEKHQIVDTFGEPYIFFFGESPRFLDVTAILINSLDFNWYAEWWDNYNQYLRGTRLVEQGARTYLFYDDNIVEGYMLMAQTRLMSEQPMTAQLTFRLYVTNSQNVSLCNGQRYPVRQSATISPSVDLTTAGMASIGSIVMQGVQQDQLNQAVANQAALGSSQQAGGFGGALNLSGALRQGMSSTGTASIDGILQNAEDALMGDGDQIRTRPLRGLIADNLDEYTAMVPPADPPEFGSGGSDAESDQVGQPDTPDLHHTLVGQAAFYGADINSPNAFAGLGVSASFSASAGFGMGSSSVASASFGPRASNGGGGINGGLGFTGVFTASSSLSLGVGASASAGTTNAGVAYNSGVYGNGVLIQGGISQGIGMGGGIPDGVSGGLAPDGSPGGLTQFTGGTSFSSTNGFSSSQGYGFGLQASGASVSVGGAPSAFAMVVAPGTLQAQGSVSVGF